jgi:glycosyltransferase involved in cell wall biosynthesis
MKILFYIHHLNIGGAETIVVDYILNLKKKGLEVALVVIRHSDSFLEKRVINAGIRIYALNEECKIKKLNGLKWRIQRRFIGYKRKWENILQIERPDIIHINTNMDTLDGVNFPATRMIFTFHATVERSLSLSSSLNKKLLVNHANEGMTFFAISEVAAKEISNIYSTEKIVKIPNAVDIQKIRNSITDRRLFLEHLNIPNDTFILGHVGRFHPVKNHEKVISVFKELNKIKPNSYLFLVGGNVDGRMDAIKKQVINYDISHNVIFFDICENVYEIMSTFDAFILPSYSESFSLTTVEAEALNKRCVVSNAVPDDVICNKNCFKMSIDESDENWAKLLLSNSVLEEHGDLMQFDINNVIEKLIEAYKNVLYKN